MITIMNNTFQKLFGPIQAEEELKNRTKAFLIKKTHNYKKKRKYHIYATVCACTLLMLFGGHWLYFIPTTDEFYLSIKPFSFHKTLQNSPIQEKHLPG